MPAKRSVPVLLAILAAVLSISFFALPAQAGGSNCLAGEQDTILNVGTASVPQPTVNIPGGYAVSRGGALGGALGIGVLDVCLRGGTAQPGNGSKAATGFCPSNEQGYQVPIAYGDKAYSSQAQSDFLPPGNYYALREQSQNPQNEILCRIAGGNDQQERINVIEAAVLGMVMAAVAFFFLLRRRGRT